MRGISFFGVFVYNYYYGIYGKEKMLLKWNK